MPSWTNRSSGGAASNGTASHTVSFGFTSRTGSLLVFIAGCPWTNTMTGWTARAEASHSTGKVSVFTKVSAGESTATVDHGGISNMQMEWAVYEFAPGSSYTGAQTGSVDTTTTFTALSLPASAGQTVLAAIGRNKGGAAGNTATAGSWTGTTTEDSDHTTDPTTADGFFMAVAHDDQLTSTVTPGVTISTSGNPFPSGQYLKVAVAISPARSTFYASGIAASADPTTVSWGYTAAAGELLYFVAFGAMTQIVPSGWTEQLNPPIADCEMSVIRKTAAGGETGITVDHNGPRPMAWAFWAFPAGSTPFGAGSAKLNNTEDGQDLTGLPGTPVTTINVQGRPIGSGDTTMTRTTAWTGATKLFDNLLLGTGSIDGAYLTGAVNHDYISTTTNVDATVTSSPTGNTARYWCAWTVEVAASSETHSGGAEAMVNLDAEAGGVPTVADGAGATTAVDAEAAGRPSPVDGVLAALAVDTEAGGTPAVTAGGAPVLEVDAQGAGTPTVAAGASAVVGIDAVAGGGTVIDGAEAAVAIDAEAGGYPTFDLSVGGAEAVIEISASGDGGTGATATVEIMGQGQRVRYTGHFVGNVEPEPETAPVVA